MLYHRESHYESGITPLVNWIPCKVEQGREECEGVERFTELIKDWETRGGEAFVSRKPAIEGGRGEESPMIEEAIQESEASTTTTTTTTGDFTTIRG